MEDGVEPKRYFRVLKELDDFKAGDIVEFIEYYSDKIYRVAHIGSKKRWAVYASDVKELTLSEVYEEVMKPEPILNDRLDAYAYGSHYAEASVQAIEAIQANMSTEAFVGYLRGNIIKYACRLGRKDKGLQEAEKIKRYAEWLVDTLKGEIVNPRR